MHRRRLKVQLLQRLDELGRHDVRVVGQRLSDLHGRAAQVAHRIEHPRRRAPVCLGQHPLAFRRIRDPAAHPVEQVGGSDLRLQRAEQPDAPKTPDRHGPERKLG
jgi:hypothetical protein